MTDERLRKVIIHWSATRREKKGMKMITRKNTIQDSLKCFSDGISLRRNDWKTTLNNIFMVEKMHYLVELSKDDKMKYFIMLY